MANRRHTTPRALRTLYHVYADSNASGVRVTYSGAFVAVAPAVLPRLPERLKPTRLRYAPRAPGLCHKRNSARQQPRCAVYSAKIMRVEHAVQR